MARGTQHRKRRTPANARVAPPPQKGKAKRVKHQSWEDELFFSRLRVHAKWVFVFLALVFGVGFVVFGVGSGSTGISDVLQNFFTGASSNGSSASSLQKQADKHPTEPKRWRDLATKLESDDKLDQAIIALKRYTALRPKDQTGLEELAGVFIRRATEQQQVYISAQTRTSILAPRLPAAPPSTSDLGKALSSLVSPVENAVSGTVGTQSSDAYGQIVDLQKQAVGVYQQLAKLSPKDAVTQYRLAQVAQGAGDTKTSLAAYERFLVLAPDDPLAAAARKQVKQLKAQLKATATPVSTHK